MAYNKLQTKIRVAGVGASWRSIRAEKRPMNMGLGREIRGPENGEKYFRDFREDAQKELWNDLQSILKAFYNDGGRSYEERDDAAKLIVKIAKAQTWSELQDTLTKLTDVFRNSITRYGDQPIQKVNESGRPQPGRFQQQNRLGWNEQQFKLFVEHIKPGSRFRKMIIGLSKGDRSEFDTVNNYYNVFFNWFQNEHPYPGIPKLLRHISLETLKFFDGVPNIEIVKRDAQQIEKRLFRLYDFARLQALKSVYAAALKAAIES